LSSYHQESGGLAISFLTLRYSLTGCFILKKVHRAFRYASSKATIATCPANTKENIYSQKPTKFFN
jgi:hypothetical protein